MTRRLLAALALAAAAALAGCSGGGDDRAVRRLLDEAFTKPIPSAVVTVDVEVKIDGVEGLGDPLRLQVTGPYRSGGDRKIPSFDWDVSFSGGGQTISGGLLSTGDNVFVNLQGTDYEVGEEQVGTLNRELAQSSRSSKGRTLSQFGIDPSTWLSEASDEGDEQVAGVETRHARAKVDVAKMLDDLNTLIDRAGSAVGGSAPPPKLSEKQQSDVENVLKQPTLDVYVGKQDKVVRRLSADFDLEVPEDSRDDLGGIEGGRIAFSIEFADVGKPVEIAAPRTARPLSQLAEQLGGLPSLGGAPGGGGRGGGQPFQRYSQCLEEADPSDIAEIQACSDLLQ